MIRFISRLNLRSRTLLQGSAFTLMALGLTACGSCPLPDEEDVSGPTVQLYSSNGYIQCESGAQPLMVTANPLSEADISVIDSQCAKDTSGMMVAAVCGAGSPQNFHIHTIAEADLAKAQALGFKTLDEVYGNPNRTYEISDCPE